ncbi:MAG: hypothetical protein KAH32_02915, partial [Chlamydiia bacterium]|nr:hypothetical protein [Chlamydiia bacterium]
MADLYFTGDDSNSEFYSSSPLTSIFSKVTGKVIALDTETNVVKNTYGRELKVVSYAWDEGKNIHVIEWDHLKDFEKIALGNFLKSKKCIIQNAKFDYTVLKTHDIELENMICTMLGEQILTSTNKQKTTGYGLQAIVMERFEYDLSKGEQLTFGEGGPYNDAQIEYAAIDVMYLEQVADQQLFEMRSIDKFNDQPHNKGLVKTWWWENEYVKVLGDMEIQGLNVDTEQLYKVSDELQIVHDNKLYVLNQYMVDNFKGHLLSQGKYFKVDTLTQNIWTSSKAKTAILGELFPDMNGTAKQALKVYLQEHDPDFPEGLTLTGKKWNESEYRADMSTKYAVLKMIIAINKGNKGEIESALNEFLLTNLRDLVDTLGYLHPAGSVIFNWNSAPQRLAFFQTINPDIESTGKDVIIDFIDDDPVVGMFIEYNDTVYKLNTYGRGFYDNNHDGDLRIRSNFKQILATGRVSSSKVNILAYPGDIEYRKAIVADPGTYLTGSDFDAEELAIIATLSGEESWLEFLREGKDLHSLNAKFMFGPEWVMASEMDCEFEKTQKKCSCPKHMEMRNQGKTLVFLSSYGGSAFALAFKMKISEARATELLENFYLGVPAIRQMMDDFGTFALDNGFIYEPVFGRIKFYDKWRLSVDRERGAIQRTANNFPIQSSGAAILKIFGVLFRRWLKQSGYREDIWLLLLIHDESLTQTKNHVPIDVRSKVEHYMKLSARLAGFNIGAEAVNG